MKLANLSYERAYCRWKSCNMKLTFPVFWLIEYQPDSSSLKYGHPHRGLLAVYWQNVRFSIIISTRIFDISVVPEHLSSAKWFIILNPAKDPNYKPVSLRVPSDTWRSSYLDEMSLSVIKGRWNQTLYCKRERVPDSTVINGRRNHTTEPKRKTFRMPYGILFNYPLRLR